MKGKDLRESKKVDDRIQISAYIDADLRTQFDVACARRRLKIQDALEEAIRDWVKKESKIVR